MNPFLSSLVFALTLTLAGIKIAAGEQQPLLLTTPRQDRSVRGVKQLATIGAFNSFLLAGLFISTQNPILIVAGSCAGTVPILVSMRDSIPLPQSEYRKLLLFLFTTGMATWFGSVFGMINGCTPSQSMTLASASFLGGVLLERAKYTSTYS
jgi:hypothetical protein